MNQKCKKCGHLIDNDARFCRMCGSSDFELVNPDQPTVIIHEDVQSNENDPLQSAQQVNYFGDQAQNTNFVPPQQPQQFQQPPVYPYQQPQPPQPPQQFQQPPVYPYQQPQQPQQPPAYPYQQPPKKKSKGWLIALIVGVVLVLAGIGYLAEKALQEKDSDVISSTKSEYSSKKPDETTTKRKVEYTKGTFDGTTYINKWANIKIDAPDAYLEATEETYNSMQDGVTDCGVALSNGSGMIAVLIEDLSSQIINVTEEYYFDRVMQGLEEDSTVDYETPDDYEQITVAGEVYLVAHVKGYYDGVTFYQSYYVRKQEDRMIAIFIQGESFVENNSTVALFKEVE